MQEFIHYITSIDKALFAKINQVWVNRFFDVFFPFITNFKNTAPYIGMILIFWIVKRKKIALQIILGAILSVGLADLITNNVVKPTAHRNRPEFSTVGVQLRVPHQGSPSFTSSHAGNAFAAATFIGMFFPALRTLFWFFAFLVAYSRVYCGVHYPFDVLGGAVLGFLCAVYVYRLWGYRIHGQLPVWKEPKVKIPRYRRKR
jgi:undecaprenyl-diphosphatase